MSPRLPDPSGVMAPHISAFLNHKRALNRKYDVEDKALRLLDRHLNEVGIKTLAEITLVLVLFVGWFGPRGLASVVFALIALEDLDQRVAGPVVTVIAVTVLFSVVAHGATADPLARRCGPRVAQAAGGSVDPSDDLGTPPLPERRLIRRASPIRHAS